MNAVLRKRWLPVAGALLSTLLVAGCQSVAGSTSETQVRVIDAAYNAPAVNVDIGSTPIATNLGAGTITNYAILGVQNSAAASVFPTSSKTPTATATASGTFGAGQQHSVYITNSGSTYTAAILTDQDTPAPSGNVSVRFLQQALSTGAVDIYFVPSGGTLADSDALLSDVTTGTITSYINVPAGTYTVVVTATGSITSKYTSASMTLTSGAVRTMLIMDAQLTSNPPVNVVVGDDLD
jgi:hypothetical protein